MRKLRVLVLMHRELLPPDSVEGLSEEEVYRWKMEFDVLRALRTLGHEVIPLGVTDELSPIRSGLREHKPHLVFNLLGHFQGITLYDSHVVSWLELRRMPYTGCNPRGLLLSSDKVLSKKILAWHRIPIPGFAVFPRGKTVRKPKRLRLPLFVKSAAEHASIGIAQKSIVQTEAALVERVAFIHESIGTDAIAEEYVEGRELYVGVIGNQRLTVLPTWELMFDNLPKGTAPIATSRVKWSVKYQEKLGVRTGPAEKLPDEVSKRLPRLVKRIYKALGLSGYARIDLRLDDEGRIFVLEANGNPDLSRDEDFAESARKMGIEFPALLQKVMSLGLRYMPAWKEE